MSGPPADAGRQLNVASASHAQYFYAHVDYNAQTRGINGPMFTRQVCGGANMNGALLNPDDFQGRNPLEMTRRPPPWQLLTGSEHVTKPWAGNPLGLNVRVPTPVKKGDQYRTGTHYKSRHDPTVPPSNSTLGLTGTQCPGVTNLEGVLSETIKPKSYGFIGNVPGTNLASTTSFLRTREKHRPLPMPTRFYYPDEGKQAPRPPRASDGFGSSMAHLHQAPNFVVQNQVDCILESQQMHQDRQRVMSEKAKLNKSEAIKAEIIGTTRKLDDSLKKTKMSHTMMSMEEKQLNAAKRADFETLLSGTSIKSADRASKLNKVLKMRNTLEKTQELELTKQQKRPRTVQEKHTAMQLSRSRPMTMQSELSYADSAASSEYLHGNRIVKKMPMEVRKHLIRTLKKKWDEINKEYQLLTLSLFNLDTVHKVSKKEDCEAMMARLEKDIAKLSKGNVYVSVDDLPAYPE